MRDPLRTGLTAPVQADLRSALRTPLPSHSGPLLGVRVCDFTIGKAGPQATAILADLGAEVIKVERPGQQRRAVGSDLPLRAQMLWGMGPGYGNNNNRNKFSVTVDVKNPRAHVLVEKLIGLSDVVTASFSAHVLPSWGLTFERLEQIRPGIICLSMPGFGHTGPYSSYQTLGPSVQAASGLTYMSGRPDMPPAGWGYSYMDNTGGYYGAMAVLLALVHRARTSEGQFIDLAQVEAGATLNGSVYLDYTVNKRRFERIGNRSLHPPAAPHGVYRCAGEDRWCAISVETDGQWRALRQAMGEPAWAIRDEFATRLARYHNQDSLDSLLEQWTATQGPFDLMERLQRAGVPAGVVQTGVDLGTTDPQLKGFFPEAEHPQLGLRRFEGVPTALSRTPGGVFKAAPLPGEHNQVVFEKILGVSRDLIEELSKEGVI